MVVDLQAFKAVLTRFASAVMPLGSRRLKASEQRSGPARSSGSGANPDTFIPPAERVHQLLAEHEGITWQGRIVAETDWSAPKTSRVLSEMEENGEIARYRVGREKVVCLPGRKPDGIQDGTEATESATAEPPTARV